MTQTIELQTNIEEREAIQAQLRESLKIAVMERGDGIFGHNAPIQWPLTRPDCHLEVCPNCNRAILPEEIVVMDFAGRSIEHVNCPR